MHTRHNKGSRFDVVSPLVSAGRTRTEEMAVKEAWQKTDENIEK